MKTCASGAMCPRTDKPGCCDGCTEAEDCAASCGEHVPQGSCQFIEET